MVRVWPENFSTLLTNQRLKIPFWNSVRIYFYCLSLCERRSPRALKKKKKLLLKNYFLCFFKTPTTSFFYISKRWRHWGAPRPVMLLLWSALLDALKAFSIKAYMSISSHRLVSMVKASIFFCYIYIHNCSIYMKNHLGIHLHSDKLIRFKDALRMLKQERWIECIDIKIGISNNAFSLRKIFPGWDKNEAL